MLSRRSFLIGLFVLTQLGLLLGLYQNVHPTRNGKLIRQGWVLQGGDI